MDKQPNSARRILEVFKEGSKFLCLRDLAKASGFPRASNPRFKEGFNYLVEKGILKLRQSGWSSEKRGANNHPKTVILTANIYEVVDSEFEVNQEKLLRLSQINRDAQQELSIRSLPLKWLNRIKKCGVCKKLPVVFVTLEKIPICARHWKWLGNSDDEW